MIVVIGLLVLRLYTREKVKVLYPNHIHGFVYHLLKDSTFGKRYHEQSSTPFAIKRVKKSPQGELQIELSVFDYEVLTELIRSFPIDNNEVVIGGHSYLCGECAIHPTDHPHARLVNYEDFLNAPFQKEWCLRVHNGVFRQGKNDYLPLPEPERMVESLLRKWNQFSAVPFDEPNLGQELASHLLIKSCEIKTNRWIFKKGITIPAFSGKVVLLNNHRDDYMKRKLSALILFSSYSGIGLKTAYGMGSVDIQPSSMTKGPRKQEVNRLED